MLSRLRHWGLTHRCPVCRARLRRFVTLHPPGRRHAMCPRCGALERHRHLWLYLERHTDLLRTRKRLLHLGPEPALEARFRELEAIDYLTGDLEPGTAMRQLDLRALDLPGESFDAILCLHVLEHVDDDHAAMRELHRVLRPGGWAIVQVPLYGDATHEDASVTDPQERAQRFGQDDHVRLYGRDFLGRLAQAGFAVRVDHFRDELTPRERRRYGLAYDVDFGVDFDDVDEAWEIYLCERPR